MKQINEHKVLLHVFVRNNEVTCVESFRVYYDGAKSYLDIDSDYWDIYTDDEFKSFSSNIEIDGTWFISDDFENAEGPLECALVEEWLKMHTEHYIREKGNN